jgi:hypothetical protein
MGNLGFDDFIGLLKFRAGGDSSLDAATLAFNYYGVWINQAYRQLCSQDGILGLKKRLYFPQLFTDNSSAPAHTVSGTPYISVPTGCLYVTEVFDDTNKKKLTQIPWKRYVGYTDRTTTASYGDPSEWTRSGTKLYLHSTPGTSGDHIIIYYKKLPDDLSGSLPTELGAEWDDAIIELAAYKMFTWLHEYDKSKVVKESFLEMAAGLADIYYMENKDREESFGPSPSYMG